MMDRAIALSLHTYDQESSRYPNRNDRDWGAVDHHDRNTCGQAAAAESGVEIRSHGATLRRRHRQNAQSDDPDASPDPDQVSRAGGASTATRFIAPQGPCPFHRETAGLHALPLSLDKGRRVETELTRCITPRSSLR